ncbi:MAG: hypothetical protein KIT83_13540 [Bryobacterales bacterium]|nr:hypothetical protein [Bryobacterales bacterium]
MRASTSQTGALTRWKRATGKALAILLAVVLAMPSLPAQSNEAPGAAPTRLKIQALTPAPLTEIAGTLSANVLQVRITDEWDMPVRGATVSFRMPEAGPGGVFLNGLSSEIALTDERGEAAVRGFDWRSDAGITFVHVIAAFGTARAGAMVEVHLARKVKEFPSSAAGPANPAPAERATAPASTVTENPPPEAREVAAEPRAVNPVIEARPALGQAAPEPAPEERRAALLPTVNRAPRDLPSEPPDTGHLPPMVRVKGKAARRSDDDSSDPAARALVGVKQNGGGGGGKALLVVLVAGAAAGGALAVSMGRGGGGSAGGPGGGTTPPPVIRIGNPTITITGGN